MNDRDSQGATRMDGPFSVMAWLWLGLTMLWLGLYPARPALAAADIRALAVPVNLAGQLDYVELAPDRTLAEVLQLPARAWQSNRAGRTSFPNSRLAYWFRVRLDGVNARPDQVRYLRLNYPHHDSIDVHVVRDGQRLASFQGGDLRPFAVRPVDNRVYLFPLDARWGEQVDVYLRVRTGGPVTLPLDVLTRAQQHDEDARLFLWAGAYFGIVAIMLVYNALVWAIIRHRAYGFYLAYIAATAFYQYTLLGLGFEHLWPRAPGMNNLVIVVLLGLVPLAAVVFISSFIEIYRIGTRLERNLSTLLMAMFAAITAASFVLPYDLALRIGAVASFGAILTGVYLGVRYWYRGVRSARLFAIAWFLHLLFIIWYLADVSHMVDSTFWSRNAFTIGSALELALMSIAFADKLNEEKNLRLTAQQDLLQVQVRMTEDLEQRVRARTEELEAANRKLEEISTTDGLTGLRNRRHFDATFSLEYLRAYREKTWVAVLMVDIDHFKKLNDSYGHQVGDLCLRTAGRLIRESINRPSDLAARYGGEEFVVLLPNTNLAGAVTIARQIHQRFADTVVESGATRLTMTVSIGVAAQVPAESEGRDLLLKLADAHLYRAKAAGRNRVVWEDEPGDVPDAVTV